MKTNQTLKLMLPSLLQLAVLTVPAKAQPVNDIPNNYLVNASISADGKLTVIPSKTSSKNDFDFLIGSWSVTNHKLKTRLNNCKDWLRFDARNPVTKILNGIGNTDRYYATINNSPFEGMTLRLFDPQTRLWTLYWADSDSGKLEVPVVGSFENNIGTFYANDSWQGEKIIVMFKWDKTNPDKPTWSQAFSANNGKTWEWNWYMYFEKAKNDAKDPELSENQNIKVLELRNYILKPGKRDDFINYFEQHFITSQNILGGYVLGQFRVKGADNRFLWFRGFNDMESRSIYLPEFYRKSLVWKKYKTGANDLIDDNDDVHLLKPLDNARGLNEGINSDDFAGHRGIVVVDYYAANNGRLDSLISLYRNKFAPYLQTIGINNTRLWVSELAPNDFPSLPVIQDKNLLVVITFYKDEADYRLKLNLAEKNNQQLQRELNSLLKNKQSMIAYPTERSFGETGE
jgi:hypothetical protein